MYLTKQESETYIGESFTYYNNLLLENIKSKPMLNHAIDIKYKLILESEWIDYEKNTKLKIQELLKKAPLLSIKDPLVIDYNQKIKTEAELITPGSLVFFYRDYEQGVEPYYYLRVVAR